VAEAPPRRLDVEGFIAHLRGADWHTGQVVHVEHVPPTEARYGELRHTLHPALLDALVGRRNLPLYAHQVEAIDAVLDGEDVAVVTPAASGKSLCYGVPVVQTLLDDPSSRALLLFPTKALAQDQLRSLRELLPERSRQRAMVFDGDTPRDERAEIRRSAQVILTNPDMLHFGILPNHQAWSRYFRSLRYVVIDEAHAYRGVFGSHLANVIRRLRRICRTYGADPVFVLSSATIANPEDHAQNLTGRAARIISEDAAPSSGRYFVFWNPPIVDEGKATRASASSEAARLLEMLLRRDVRTLAFVRTRRQAELVYMAVRDRLSVDGNGLAQRVRPYRASYLPEDRRAVETGLANGELLGVVATNALELGIDVGDLEATVLAGYPGSIASTWQQAGRAGRRGHEALSILVGQDNPLDQYLMRHPDFFFGRPHEHARTRPGNPHILKAHLLCASYEAPLDERDVALFGRAALEELVPALESDGLLHQRRGRWFPVPSIEYPAQSVNIRSASSGQFAAVEAESGRVLERVEEHSAYAQLHRGAIYLHQGEPYIVERLDLTTKAAYLKRTDAPYYTESRELTDIRITATHAAKKAGGASVALGEVEVSRAVVGYRRKSIYGNEVLGEETLEMPEDRFPTVALWFDVPGQAFQKALRERADLAGGLHAMEHAAIGVLPLFALCDRNDIGGVSTVLHADTGGPVVFIYDGHPGGVGIAEHGYEIVDELWRTTLAAVAECGCVAGCPACIQSPKCGNNNHPLDKAVAADLLRALVHPASR